MTSVRWTTQALGLGLATAVAGLLVGGCGGSAESGLGEPAHPTIAVPTSDPRPVVFPPGELVWAQRSTIHVGHDTYDVSPHLVRQLQWTPYALYLQLSDSPVNGPYWYAEFDGTELRAMDDVYSDIVASSDGRYAAWIERNGPQRPAGRVAQVVLVDAATGEDILHSAEGMGGEEGDDLSDRYEELPPEVLAFKDGKLLWVNSEGHGSLVSTDLTSGESTVSRDWSRWDLGLTTGLVFASPDGKYTGSAEHHHRLTIEPEQPNFGHKWQVQGGWLADHVLLVLAQDRRPVTDDATEPDRTPGFFLACDLDRGQVPRGGAGHRC